jgi:hypothetical protein
MKLLFASALVCLFSVSALATANFVYHQQTTTPVGTVAGAPTACGNYVDNTDKSGISGFQIYSDESYTLRYKIECRFFTNSLALYYTTDGTSPAGSFGNPGNASTQVIKFVRGTQSGNISYTCSFQDPSTCGVDGVDVATAVIPAQPAGTTVRYKIGAWFNCQDGTNNCGPEVFANNGQNCTTSSCATQFQYDVIPPAGPTPLIISEFRTQGPNGPTDEFIEIYNKSESDVFVNASDLSPGFAVVAPDALGNPVIRCIIPNGTTIKGKGHYLCVNSLGYSLAGYPSGDGTGSTTATGDATYTPDIPDNRGIALFNTATPVNFTEANRLDAVGSTAEPLALYKEGTGNTVGYAPVTNTTANGPGASPSQWSFYRNLVSGLPQDTDNNAADLVFVDTFGYSRGPSPQLGAPGPENRDSPIQRFYELPIFRIDQTKSATLAPNRVRNRSAYADTLTPSTGDGGGIYTNGTLSVRRRIVNARNVPVTRLRFRVVDITTFPSPATSVADIRVLTSPTLTGATAVTTDDPAACGGTAPCSVTVYGTTLEQPPNQPNGGGHNSSLSCCRDTTQVTLLNPIPPGGSINVHLLLGVIQNGTFRFFITVEALP